jgi:glycosyltransferase involved in cell wall biosynthesis
MRPTRILVVSAGFLPAESHGGVPYSSFHLSRELARDPSVEVKVVTSDRNGAGRLALAKDRWSSYGGLPVAYCTTWPGSYTYAPAMGRILGDAVDWADAVLSSGTLWDYSGGLTARLCSRQRKPHFVYPHGLLNTLALGNKRLKKQLGLWLQGRRILREASVIVALSPEEERSVRSLGVDTPVAVIPNGAPEVAKFNAEDEATADLPPSPYLLYLGRIARNKGLEQTLDAFTRVLAQRPSAVLVVAGPVHPEFAARFEELCRRFDRRQLVLPGAVSGPRKHQLLKNAAGFVLTSAHEGVPMGVLEALQYGLPVIVTPECNVAGVQEHGAGWVVPFGDVGATAQALLAALAGDADTMRRGAQARLLAQSVYAWPGIARRTLELVRRTAGVSQ